MARIQILELPSEEDADGKIVTPFALVLDQCTGDEVRGSLGNDLANFRDMCGARAAIVSTGTLDIPGLTPEEMAAYGPRPHVGVYVGDREITDVVNAEPAQPDALTEFINGIRSTVAAYVASGSKRDQTP